MSLRSAAVTLGILMAACATPPSEESAPPPETEDFVEKAGTLSCTPRRDTGYEYGRAFSIEVLTVDGKPVERETAEAYWKMQQAAARDGVYLRIVSGFRTQGEQQYLYGCYVHCDCNGCNLAARPGYSNHQSGYALDLNTADGGVLWWLNRNGARYGFARTVPSEDWHWEYMGGGASGAWPCDGGAPGGPPPAGGGGGGSYTVGWGGSCWDAGQALGCPLGSLVNCTAVGRDCDALWAGDRLACGAAACAGGPPAPPSGGSSRGATYLVPSGGSCGQAARALGCAQGSLYNCTSPESGCHELWAGDTLACRAADCR